MAKPRSGNHGDGVIGMCRERARGSRARLGVALWVGLVLLSPALSATAPAAQSAQAGAMTAPPPASPVLRLSLNEALALFFKQNLDLVIAKFGIDYAKGQEITAHLFPNPTFWVGTLSAYTQGQTMARSGQVFP